jgi:hypothetical protein
MADETPDGEVNNDDQKIVIGDVELSPDETKDLVTKGKTFKELSEKYPDINFEELPKSFTKTRQELADLKKPKSKETDEGLSDEEVARRKSIKDFFADPLVKEELKNMTSADSKTLKEDLEFQKVMESLESEFDGADGRPKFVAKDVLVYGQGHNIFNPRTAYNELHATELDEWKIKNAMSKPRPSTFFEKKGGAGSKQPEPKEPTNFREATAAALENEE